jgi:hypothetical protein
MPTSDYPRLAEMGILNPLQIDRYQVNSISNSDVLRIFYDRGEASYLPSTRTYKFPRAQKKKTIGVDKKQTQTVMESHPSLSEAVEELDKLLATKEHKESVAESAIAELDALEEEVAMRSAYIRELIKRL